MYILQANVAKSINHVFYVKTDYLNFFDRAGMIGINTDISRDLQALFYDIPGR